MKTLFTTLLSLIIIINSVDGQTIKRQNYDNGDKELLIYYSGSDHNAFVVNGDKQIVIHYQGSGDNEYVIKKNHYYTQNQGGGLKKVETYRSGKLHGLISEYTAGGILSSVKQYVNGSLLTELEGEENVVGVTYDRVDKEKKDNSDEGETGGGTRKSKWKRKNNTEAKPR